MAHHTLIDGTVRQISGGRSLIGGTAYGIKSGRTLCQGTGYDISFGTPVSSLPVGTSVYLNEAGVPAEYLIVHQGNPNSTLYDASCNGVWLLRKDIYERRAWDTADSNDYANSSIHIYLNSTYLARLDANIQSAIKQVKIPYVNGIGGSAIASGANGLSAKIFLLSILEVGLTNTRYAPYTALPVDGAKLDYFLTGTSDEACNLRIANLNGQAYAWWLRSPDETTAQYVWQIQEKVGDASYLVARSSSSVIGGIRPALILPSDVRVNDDMLIAA